MRALGRLLLCLLAPARAQHSNSPLFVFMHVVKTGGTAMEKWLARVHGDDARCSLRPKDTRDPDYAEYWRRRRGELLARCAVVTGEFDVSFVEVVRASTNRTIIPLTVLRHPLCGNQPEPNSLFDFHAGHPAERVASWYAMRLRQFRGRVPCVDAPASNGSALARVLDVLTDARSQTICASETSLRCCLRESNVPRKCMQGGVCGAARNLMTMIFAGSDDAGAVPFRGDLCRTATSKKRTRIALQLDDGAELLARTIENAKRFAHVGVSSNLSATQCVYLSLLEDSGAALSRTKMKALRAQSCEGGAVRHEGVNYERDLGPALWGRLLAYNRLDLALFEWARRRLDRLLA